MIENEDLELILDNLKNQKGHNLILANKWDPLGEDFEPVPIKDTAGMFLPQRTRCCARGSIDAVISLFEGQTKKA